MSEQPPFDITPAILNTVEKIGEWLGRLEGCRKGGCRKGCRKGTFYFMEIKRGSEEGSEEGDILLFSTTVPPSLSNTIATLHYFIKIEP